jgi:hypothetical protein
MNYCVLSYSVMEVLKGWDTWPMRACGSVTREFNLKILQSSSVDFAAIILLYSTRCTFSQNAQLPI